MGLNFVFTIMLSLLAMGTSAQGGVNTVCADCEMLDFEKPVQLALLRPMLQMTTEEKIKYIQSFGIELFRVKDPAGDAIRLGQLPEASLKTTPHLAAYLKEFQDNAVGLFLTSANISYGVSRPTILFVESADDWTILHEFMHFLFERARLLNKPIDEGYAFNSMADAQEDFFEAWNNFRSDGRYKDRSAKGQTVDSFVTYSDAQQRFLLTFELEEAVIEKQLREYYLMNRAINISPAEFDRSTRYIEGTTKKAVKVLAVLGMTCKDLRKSLEPDKEGLFAKVSKTCLSAAKLRRSTKKFVSKVIPRK